MLRNVNFLYLGCKVLILLDRKFQGRFWTQFEGTSPVPPPAFGRLCRISARAITAIAPPSLSCASPSCVCGCGRAWAHASLCVAAYIAMRMASDKGLINCPDESRWTAEVPYDTDSVAQMKAMLREEWGDCLPQRAYEKLSAPDIAVTNQSDKEIMLPKLLSLDKQVRDMMRGESLRVVVRRKVDEQIREMRSVTRRGSRAERVTMQEKPPEQQHAAAPRHVTAEQSTSTMLFKERGGADDAQMEC